MRKVANEAAVTLSGSTISQRLSRLTNSLGKKVGDHVLQGAIRTAFLIELVKDDVSSTKFAVRWSDRFDRPDPRYASFETSVEIFEYIIATVLEVVQNNSDRETLDLFSKWNKLPYELPLDYVERRRSISIHEKQNVRWLQGDLPSNVIKLRSYLLDQKQSAQVKLRH